ncbi:hemoglobin-like flavoprotein [Nocardiopsis arvandica]|uniref:Hemoglobin-like flavoprotein n=1 Tax=Nocardiopsis sinuspersici TaxID=501010 RepID=A0A7Y9XF33_9ACTN|nr:globin domain-containing protein [Nocardiopsis sinuspersici]NYH53195.1 hemoglobin-like flavoprotein [Nocardiopsis sinuspersici]
MSPRSIKEVPLPAPAVIEAVRHSCSSLPHGSTRLAERFYQNLFSMAPEVRAMFPENMRTQKERMAFALLEVVHYLDQPDEVAGYLRQLGAQHRRELAVEPEHYPYVGRALVRAVSEISPTWSSSMSSAWVMVYEWITANMLEGARDADAGRPAKRSRHAAAPSESRPDQPARSDRSTQSDQPAPPDRPHRSDRWFEAPEATGTSSPVR